MESTVMPMRPEPDASLTVISVRKAAEEIGINRQYLKGYAEAIGVRLVESGRSLLMSRNDFDRLRHHLADRD